MQVPEGSARKRLHDTSQASQQKDQENGQNVHEPAKPAVPQAADCNVVTWTSVFAGTEMRTYQGQPGTQSRLAGSRRLSPSPSRQGCGPGQAYLICKYDVPLDHFRTRST